VATSVKLSGAAGVVADDGAGDAADDAADEDAAGPADGSPSPQAARRRTAPRTHARLLGTSGG
jgi:hypothetical protein